MSLTAPHQEGIANIKVKDAAAVRMAAPVAESFQVEDSSRTGARVRAPAPIQDRERMVPVVRKMRSASRPPRTAPSAPPPMTIVASQPEATFGPFRASCRYVGYQDMIM